jgi:hypothetical protein
LLGRGAARVAPVKEFWLMDMFMMLFLMLFMFGGLGGSTA